ncbi:hypothetical protein [Carboxylicivirga taeanensis]|uniref:hypothetical protein n=1 Tax=Carboxylicivirga taeanensis TaxID=1416875 RepID=UPI003F6DBC34
MQLKFLAAIIIISLLSSCASIPKETVELSKVLGSDIQTLQRSHESMIDLYYNKIITDVNRFIDDVYAPFIIHYVLKKEMENYSNQQASIYGTIEAAGKTGGKTETDEALNVMTEFLEDANYQIEKKRTELLTPITQQKKELIARIKASYANAIYANLTITSYLESIRKVKEAQQEALSLAGLDGAEAELNSILLQTSDIVETAINKGKEIDIKSKEALQKIEEITKQIKTITNKTK